MLRLRFGLLVAIAFLLSLPGCQKEESAKSPDADKLLALRPGPAGFKCQDIDAFIPQGHSIEGQACQQNKAVVNGWSILCVAQGQCSTPARLGELNTAAEEFCAGWCKAKNCGYQYSNRDKCDSAWCVNSKDCQAACNVPFRDACFFQQSKPSYNCECRDKVEG